MHRESPVRARHLCQSSETLDNVDGPIKLDVLGCRLPVRNGAIGLHTPALKQFSTPGIPSSGRDPDVVAVGDLIDAAADQAPGGLASNYRCQLALLSKGGDAFAGAGGALIHQEGGSPVEWLGTQTLRHDAHRIVAEAELQSEQNQGGLLGRDSVEGGEGLLRIVRLRSRTSHAVSNGDALGRQIAHHPEKGQPATGVAAKVDDQPVASIQFLNGSIDLFCDIDADSARELRHLQPPDAIRYL